MQNGKRYIAADTQTSPDRWFDVVEQEMELVHHA